ncbi:MAG: bifunctional demethylmenaquinone methyltransferase/2-methoxy-6-polyprenyl-1,4-benzoquinol methylase UbiE [Saprospiraceae bacterium]|nr:bifunctional demethylmenaquinone methyltransferase/2-methoxy-6-polyprenyl-1,4-benzoquinol methylase UbiE [Saprospiraceae bacterium]
MQHNEITPYKDGSSKKQQVRSMFDNIARRYDLLNRLLTGGIDTKWRKITVKHALKSKPKIILDIATGTGDIAILLARNAPDCQITALDLSEKMLELARVKSQKRSLATQITFLQGDSENLPFDDNTYDAITVAFGVRNFENTMRGLEEARRVLKPGGQMNILEFSRPTTSPFKQLYLLYFRHILPVIGKLTSKDKRAYSYLFESSQAFPDGTEFVNLMRQAGFTDTFHQSLTFGICTLYSGKK